MEKDVNLISNNAFATSFPSYNKQNLGTYVKDWPEMLEKLQKPVILNMNQQDWDKLKETNKKQALAYKFRNGGYIAGACPVVKSFDKDGNAIERPSASEGVPRPATYNAIVLDADGPKDGKLDDDFDEKLKNVLSDYEYYAHATISSKPGKLKRRVIIPVEVPVTLDVREAVIRYIGEKVGITNIDEACVRGKQLMCFPVFVGDNYSYHNTGKRFNATEWLPAGWEHMENWPVWPGKKPKQRHATTAGRKIYTETGEWLPVFDKNKIHNAFNYTYRISDILKKSGKYEQTGPGRWSHTYDTAKDGIKVTNDSILYSYYGNDILSIDGDLDAFETAILLFHGSLDKKENWTAMYREAVADEKVKETMLKAVMSDDLPADAGQWQQQYDSTEEGIAQRCMAMFPHKMRGGKWYKYNNGIYKQVKPEAVLPDVLRVLRITAALQPDDADIQLMVGRKNTAQNVLTIWGGLLAENEIPEENWENKPWYMHFTDYTIDLQAYCEGREFKLQHSPDYLLTQSTRYAWADLENINPDVFKEVLENIAVYLPDEELRNYFQRACGRALVGGISSAEDKCVWLLSAQAGCDGGNGKSTLLAGIKGALGGDNPASYYYEVPGKYLYYNSYEKGDAEAPSPVKAGMADRRFIQFPEYNGIRTLDPEKYKTFTSAGFITARKLHSDNNSFPAKCCCFLDTNSMPGLQRREYAVLRRSRVVPFKATLKGDASIKAKYMHNHDIHVAVMAWLLLGLKDWFDCGMKLDAGIDDKELVAPDVYFETMAWINSFEAPEDFFNDYYDVTHYEKDYLIPEDCYEAYLAQCYDKGATKHAFAQAETRWLHDHGIDKKAKRPGRDGVRRMYYVGVRLRDGKEDEAKRIVTPQVEKVEPIKLRFG